MTNLFTPPSYEVGINTNIRPFNYFRTTISDSVVRINGVLTQVKTPHAEGLRTAGSEGTDWFMGGRIYEVTDAVKTELENAGFVVQVS